MSHGVGWTVAWKRMLAFEAVQKGGLFPADISSCSPPQIEVKGEVLSQNPVPQESAFVGFPERSLQGLESLGILVTEIDETPSGSGRVGCQDHPLNHAMGIVVHQDPVFETAGFSFVRVTDKGFRVPTCILNSLPFASGWKARSAAPGQLTLADGPDDVVRLHFQDCPVQGLIATAFPVAVHRRAALVADPGKDALFDAARVGRRERRGPGDQGVGVAADKQGVTLDDGYGIITASGAGHFFGAFSECLQKLQPAAETTDGSRADSRMPVASLE